jgi:hypothetical protein
MSKQNKKITLDGLSDKVDKLASVMEAGFKRVEGRMDKGFKDAKENNEFLARMTAKGFEDVAKSFEDVNARMATKDDLLKLEQGQENIQLRLDSMAPYFEVKQLEHRVKRLEERAGIHNTIQR